MGTAGSVGSGSAARRKEKGMKSKWKVASNIVGGEMLYGVYRLLDVNEVMHSGNIEIRGYYDGKAAAKAEAERLNREGGKDED